MEVKAKGYSSAETKWQETAAVAWAPGAPSNGRGVNAWNEGINAEKVALMMEAAELGNGEAMKQLIDVFLYGKQGFKVDYAIVKENAERAIASGFTDSLMYTALGRVHSDNTAWGGYNAPEKYVDYELALKYFQQSAKSGFKDNRYIAYLFYYNEITGLKAENGDATAKDTAVKYMLKAADRGDATANAEIGKWYVSGGLKGTNGMTPAELAVHYFEKAVSASNNHGTPPGVKAALIALASIYENGSASSCLNGIEGANGIQVSLENAVRILKIMCSDSYYKDEFAEDLARVQAAQGN